MMTARHMSKLASRGGQLKMPLPHELVDFDLEDDYKFQGDDIPAGGHLALHQQRQVAYYMRLIENDMPQLAGKSCVPSISKSH